LAFDLFSFSPLFVVVVVVVVVVVIFEFLLCSAMATCGDKECSVKYNHLMKALREDHTAVTGANKA